MLRFIFLLLLHSSATTNDTAISGSDIAVALKSMFPSIQDAEIKALIAVCSPNTESDYFSTNLLFRPIHYQLLPPRIFSSKLLQEMHN